MFFLDARFKADVALFSAAVYAFNMTLTKRRFCFPS